MQKKSNYPSLSHKRRTIRKKLAVTGLLTATAMIPALVMEGPNVEAATTLLSEKNPGDIIKIDGVEFYVVKHITGTGTKVMRKDSIVQKVFDPDFDYNIDRINSFNPTDINNLGYYLNNNFYNSLSDTTKDMMVAIPWPVGNEYAENGEGKLANVGLLTKSEWESVGTFYGGSILHLAQSEWLLTPLVYVANNDILYIVAENGNTDVDSTRNSHEVRPALVLKSNLFVSVNGTVSLTPPDTTPPTLTVSETNGTVSATATDESGIKATKWAFGNQSVDYFTTAGTVFTNSFTVDLNTVYTVYAEDNAGNKSVQTITVTGAPISISGDFHYKIVNGTVTIVNYTGSGGHVEIPSTINGMTVTAIGSEAFRNKSITSLTLPNTIKTIGNYAFADNKLTTLVIPDGVQTIGTGAFQGNQLSHVELPKSVTTIGASAFINANGTKPTIAAYPGSAAYTYASNNGYLIESLDMTAPVITVDKTNGGFVAKQHNVKISAVDTEAGLGQISYQWSTDSTTPNEANWTVIANNQTVSTPQNSGTYYLHVKAVDKVGNVATFVTGTFIVDTIAPIVSLFPNGDTTPKQSHSVQVDVQDEGSGLANVFYQWRNSNVFPTSGSWFTLSDSTTLKTPANVTGSMYLHIKATDIAGNLKQWTSNPFVIDNTAPTKPILTSNTTALTNQHVTVTIYYASDAAIKEYSTDNGVTWKAYTGPLTVTQNGTIKARSADLAGNESEASLVVSNIDKTAPIVSLSEGTSEWGTTSTINVAIVEGESGIKVRKWADGNQSLAYFATSGVIFSTNTFYVSANGEYTVYVEDNAGNKSVKTIVVTKVDNTAPSISFSKMSASVAAKQHEVTINVTDIESGVDTIDYQWSTNNIPTEDKWVRVANGTKVVTPNNVTGSCFLHVRAKDAKGNVSSLNSGAFQLDTTPPPVPIITANKTVATNMDVLTEISYSVDSTVKEYSLDQGATWKSYATVLNFSQNGTLYARAKDAQGNISDIAIFHVNTIDKIKPSSPTYSTTDNELTLVPGTDNVSVKHVEYKIGSEDWKVYTEPVILPDGVYTIHVRTVDTARNVSDAVSFQWTIYYSQLAIAKDAVTKAETMMTQTDYNNAVVLVNKLSGSTVPLAEINGLQQRLTNLHAKLTLHLATEAVNQAEKYKIANDVMYAKTLVNELPTNSEKTSLLNRLAILERMIMDLEILNATNQVLLAEKYKIPNDVNYARTLVNALVNSESKTALIARLDMVQAAIDSKKTPSSTTTPATSVDTQLVYATQMVVQAEKYKFQNDVNHARTLVNALADSKSKTALIARLDVVQAVIDSKKTTDTTAITPGLDAQLAYATQMVVQAEKYKLQNDVNYARTLVNALADSESKTALIARLDVVQAAIDSKKPTDTTAITPGVDAQLAYATQMVVQAEKYKLQNDVKYARTLVNALADSESKTALIARLDAVQAAIDSKKPTDTTTITPGVDAQLAYATQMVAQAEKYKLQNDVNYARTLVNALADSESKTALIARLDAVQVVIDSKKTTDTTAITPGVDAQLAYATQMVAQAEKYKLQNDVDYAWKLVSALVDSESKTVLQNRLNAVQDMIDNK